MESEKKVYSYEDILELLGGHKYFTQEQALFCYHKLNGDTQEADYYLKYCLADAKKIHKCSEKLKTQREVDEISQKMHEEYIEQKYSHIIDG